MLYPINPPPERAAATYYSWRVVKDTGPWRMAKGKRLRWEMTDQDAADWQAKNLDTLIEKVPGSGNMRTEMGVLEHLMPRNPFL